MRRRTIEILALQTLRIGVHPEFRGAFVQAQRQCTARFQGHALDTVRSGFDLWRG
jgi:hypothetical protein